MSNTPDYPDDTTAESVAADMSTAISVNDGVAPIHVYTDGSTSPRSGNGNYGVGIYVTDVKRKEIYVLISPWIIRPESLT